MQQAAVQEARTRCKGAMERMEVLDGKLATCQGRLAGLGEGCSNCWRMLDETKVKPFTTGLLSTRLAICLALMGSEETTLGRDSVSDVQSWSGAQIVNARLPRMQEELHQIQWRTGLMAAAVCVTMLASVVAGLYALVMSQRVRLSSVAAVLSSDHLEGTSVESNMQKRVHCHTQVRLCIFVVM